MLKESDAKSHEQILSSVPTTPSPIPDEVFNGASSSGAGGDKTMKRLHTSDRDKQNLMRFIGQAYDISKMLKSFFQNKTVRNIAISLVGLIVLVGGVIGGGYLARQPDSPFSSNPSKTAIVPTKKFPTLLEGVDISGYCGSLGYTAPREQGGDTYCYSPISDLNGVCSWEYHAPNLEFRYSDSSNPHSGYCYPLPGGVSLDSYCALQLHPDKKGGVPRSDFIMNNTSNMNDSSNKWICRIKVDMAAACSWQNNENNVQARKDDQNQWACYGA